jgi:polyphosphate glucokinase
MDNVNRQRRQFDSGPRLTASEMCEGALALAADWEYSAVSIGIPAPIRNNRPLSNPPNLGDGWIEFDYAAAFGKPLKILNDAAMQALGSYRGGKTLFLGLGTGLGSAMVTEHLVAQMELGHMPYRKKKTFEDYVGERGLQRLGEEKWRKHVSRVVVILQNALLPEEVILGGGNARLLAELPRGCRRGNNEDAFLGGFRLWEDESIEI